MLGHAVVVVAAKDERKRAKNVDDDAGSKKGLIHVHVHVGEYGCVCMSVEVGIVWEVVVLAQSLVAPEHIQLHAHALVRVSGCAGGCMCVCGKDGVAQLLRKDIEKQVAVCVVSAAVAVAVAVVVGGGSTEGSAVGNGTDNRDNIVAIAGATAAAAAPQGEEEQRGASKKKAGRVVAPVMEKIKQLPDALVVLSAAGAAAAAAVAVVAAGAATAAAAAAALEFFL